MSILKLAVCVAALSGLLIISESARAFTISAATSPVDKYNILSGYDIFTGERMGQCFDGVETVISSADSNVSLQIIDSSSSEFRSNSLINDITVKAKGSYGPVSAKAKISSYISSVNIAKSSARSVIVRMEWHAKTGRRQVNVQGLNAAGTKALSQGVASFIRRCGSYIVTEQALSVDVAADLTLSFSSEERKRDFLKRLSGKISGTYAGASGSISGLQEIKEGYEATSSSRTVDVVFWVRGESGTKGIGSAIGQLAAAADDPFLAALRSLEELAKGMAGDRGGVWEVTFTPVHRFLPNTDEAAATNALEVVTIAYEHQAIVDFLIGARELVRRFPEHFDVRAESTIHEFDEVISRKRRVFESISSIDIDLRERLLVDYISWRCAEGRSFSIFLSLCRNWHPIFDRSVDDKLAKLRRDLELVNESCTLHTAGDNEQCSREYIVKTVLESGLVVSHDALDSMSHRLGVRDGSAAESSRDKPFSREEIRWMADGAQQFVGTEKKWGQRLDGIPRDLYMSSNLFTTNFLIDDFNAFAGDLLSQAPLTFSEGYLHPGMRRYAGRRKKIDVLLQDDIPDVYMRLLAPMSIKRMLATIDGKEVFSCSWADVFVAPAGTEILLGLTRVPVTDFPPWTNHDGDGCAGILNKVAGKMYVELKVEERLKEMIVQSYSAEIWIVGDDYWGPASWKVGELRVQGANYDRFVSGQ
jgi:hypothetical protein